MFSHPVASGALTLSLIFADVYASPLQPRQDNTPTLPSLVPVIAPETKTVAGYTAKGCYTEATKGRALTANAYFDSMMTVEKCAAACSKFAIFGVEYGIECFCGNTLNEGSVPAPEAECSFNCPGNPDEKCGAGRRLNIYEKPVTTPVVPTPGVSTYQQDGCFTEATNGRALSGKTYYDNALTIAKCASACAGFDFFGVEYYRECYCGNKLQPGSVAAPAAECFHPCTGDKNEICGGDNRLNVYRLGNGATVTPPVSTPKAYTSDGCFTEATKGRALTGSVYYDNALTVDKCSAVCKGFSIFGLEYGRECFCGNSLQAGSEKVPESQCNFPCSGNDAEFCGAGNRLNVYHFGNSAVVSSTPTSSLTATSSSSSAAAASSSPTTTTMTDTSSSETSTSTSATITDDTLTSTLASTTSTESSTISETSPTSTSETMTTSAKPTATRTESSTSSETSQTSTESTTSTISASTSSTDMSSTMPTTTSSSLSLSSSLSVSTTSPSTTSMTSSSTMTSMSSSSGVTSRTSTSSTSTSSICAPSSTQVIRNPSFEEDLDGSGTHTAPWVYSGTGEGSVQNNQNNAYKSYDGQWFAVLYGRQSIARPLSQTFDNLIPGATYTLQYFYNVPVTNPQISCELSASIRGQVVDSFASPRQRTQSYVPRSVTYRNTATGPAALSFILTCPKNLPSGNQNNFLLDAITLVTNGCS